MESGLEGPALPLCLEKMPQYDEPQRQAVHFLIPLYFFSKQLSIKMLCLWVWVQRKPWAIPQRQENNLHLLQKSLNSLTERKLHATLKGKIIQQPEVLYNTTHSVVTFFIKKENSLWTTRVPKTTEKDQGEVHLFSHIFLRKTIKSKFPKD